ncbi:hypothetical protein HPMBJEAJ_00399 [Aeromonas phage avDM6]|nr:hypothetical protein HPMBJEAJ_00399 [Aeromonas phage avDM6]
MEIALIILMLFAICFVWIDIYLQEKSELDDWLHTKHNSSLKQIRFGKWMILHPSSMHGHKKKGILNIIMLWKLYNIRKWEKNNYDMRYYIENLAKESCKRDISWWEEK